MQPLESAALAVLRGLIAAHVAEQPPGSNRGPVVDAILASIDPDLRCLARYEGRPCPHCHGAPGPLPECHGAPWCASTVTYCFEQAAASLGIDSPTKGQTLISADRWRRWGAERRLLITSPRPGCVGLIFHEGAGSHGHVVLIEGAEGRVIRTLEGNEGNACVTRTRDVTEFGGFVGVCQ